MLICYLNRNWNFTHTHQHICFTIRIIIIIITVRILTHMKICQITPRYNVGVGIVGVIHNILRHLSFVLRTHITLDCYPFALVNECRREYSPMYAFSLHWMPVSCLHIPRNDLRVIETRTVIYCALFFC